MLFVSSVTVVFLCLKETWTLTKFFFHFGWDFLGDGGFFELRGGWWCIGGGVEIVSPVLIVHVIGCSKIKFFNWDALTMSTTQFTPLHEVSNFLKLEGIH